MAYYFVGSRDLRLIVVFSPKCASESIRTWVMQAIEVATGNPAKNLESYFVPPRDVHRFTDSWKVLFLRDPLHRLVSFYAWWVVREDRSWCFADEDRRLSLRGKTFRQFLLVLQHLRRHDLQLQHHLVPQGDGAWDVPFDEVVATEDLTKRLAALNQRLGISVPIPHFHQTHYHMGDGATAADRSPAWLREHGVPAPQCFYDEETRAIALDVYAADVALYRAGTGRDVCAARAGLAP